MALSRGGPQPRGARVPGAPEAQGGAEKKHQSWPPLWEHLPTKVANQEDSSGEREPNRLASRKHNKNLAALKKLTCIHHDQLESHPIFPKEVARRYTGQRRPHRPAWQA